MFKNLKVDIKDSICTIKINRPEVRNAINNDTIKEILDALNQYENESNVKIIVITGEGNNSFAAGADITQLKEKKMLDSLLPGIQGALKKIENCNKVTVAAINGYALGGGCELALACDIRVAVKDVKIGLPELNLGIIPGAGGTQRLSRIIGKGRAMEMILTGKLIDGNEAERIGLVTKAVDRELLEETVQNIANSIITKGPIALKLAKLVINKGFDVDLETALLLEKLAQTIAFGTEDKVEGALAFLEKRVPNFENK